MVNSDTAHLNKIAAYATTENAIEGMLMGISQVTGARLVRVITVPEFGLSYARGLDVQALDEADLRLDRYAAQYGSVGTIALSDGEIELPMLKGLISHIYILPLPLHIEGLLQHLGVLWMGFAEAYYPSDGEKAYLEILASQMAINIASEFANSGLRARDQQMRAILAASQDATVVVDAAYRVQMFNPAAEIAFAVRADSVMGQSVDTFIRHEGLLHRLKGDMNAQVPDTLEMQGRFYRPMISDIHRDSGNISGRLLVLGDVTKFKRLNENLNLFLQTVSHDLRSPLTAAKGFLDMMPMVGEMNERQLGMREKVLTSIVDMTNLVEKVLDAGRLDPEMGAYELRRDLCDPANIVDKVISNLAAVAEKKQIKLYRQVSEGLPIMNLDTMMVERALMNLVENAIKYTPEQGEVAVGATLDDNALVFSVQDNGYGIPLEQQATLFDRGSRVRRKEHKSIRGSGLGLFIVKNVAQQHGGEAQVESIEGQGSVFRIYIPMQGPNLMAN